MSRIIAAGVFSSAMYSRRSMYSPMGSKHGLNIYIFLKQSENHLFLHSGYVPVTSGCANVF